MEQERWFAFPTFRIDGPGQIGIRNRHAEVRRLATGNDPMHRIEIKQIADHHFCTHIAQRLRAFVFISLVQGVGRQCGLAGA